MNQHHNVAEIQFWFCLRSLLCYWVPTSLTKSGAGGPGGSHTRPGSGEVETETQASCEPVILADR